MTDTDASPADGALTRSLKIVNKKGLHARASAKFVQCVDRFDAEVEVSKDGQTVNGTSIMGLMMLAAGIGSSITVAVSGTDAAAALGAITDLVVNRFGEDE
ncbi:HPr family phosphocarrier protein [Methylobrevis pamukkalensis]|uniref:Phosphocarrier protein HPr n=1 Tax=Methylobrevis pamukkalensis TaxID=1439726 RepID=A0A1E3GZK0_9HYPH|nr:HPr family phosphocarrier protein [Methylobrevis pamukkalensis]ODN69508.1 Phosphocarrier protein HPr [Methylobrevis pamukkalensis]